MRLTSSELRQIAEKLDQLAQLNIRLTEFTLPGSSDAYQVEMGYTGQRNEDPTYYLTGVRESGSHYSAARDPRYPYS